MPSDYRPPEIHELYLTEEALVYCFSFEDDPVICGGATISSVTAVSSDTAKMTVGSPQVNTSVFEQKDRNGVVVRSVPANKGVKVALTTVARGQVSVTVKITCSDGQKPASKAVFNIL